MNITKNARKRLQCSAVVVALVSGAVVLPATGAGATTPALTTVGDAQSQPAHASARSQIPAAVPSTLANAPAWAAVATGLAPGQVMPAPVDAPLPSQVGLRPGTAMVSPAGCTMNFVFQSRKRLAIGTAAHCLYNRDGTLRTAPVVVLTLDPTAATSTPVLVRLGHVVLITDSPFENEVYVDEVNDFALVEIPDRLQEWVSPTVAAAAGPCGAWDERGDVHGLLWHGHGVVIGTGGTTRGGVFLPPTEDETARRLATWTGPLAGGDSGGPVVNSTGHAFSVITHGTWPRAFQIHPNGGGGPTMARVLEIAEGWSLVDSPLCPMAKQGESQDTGASRGSTGGHDSVKGAFTVTAGGVPIDVTFDARSEAGGATPATGTFSGTVTTVAGPMRFSGDVTCLSTVARDASAAGHVTRSDSPLVPVGSSVLALFRDRYRPGEDHAGADEFTGAFNLPATPPCPVAPDYHNVPTDHVFATVQPGGDFTVHDANEATRS